jgi:hypothetical protein
MVDGCLPGKHHERYDLTRQPLQHAIFFENLTVIADMACNWTGFPTRVMFAPPVQFAEDGRALEARDDRF